MIRVFGLVALVFSWPHFTYARSAEDILISANRGAEDMAAKAEKASGFSFTTEIVTKDLTKSGDQQIAVKSHSELKLDYGSDSYLVSCLQTGGTGKLSNYCISIGPDYCFQLDRRGGEKSWTIGKLHITNEPNFDSQQMGFLVPARRPSRQPKVGRFVSGYQYERFEIGELGSRAGTTVTSASKDDGTGRTTIAFDHDLAVSTAPNTPAVPVRVRSNLVLDTAHFYLPLEFTETFAEGGKTYTHRAVWVNEFEGDLPKKVTTTTTTKIVSGASTLTHVEEINSRECIYGPVPPADFTLSVYGFPEPPGLPSRSRSLPTYAWALLVAAACAAVVFGLRRWKSHT